MKSLIVTVAGTATRFNRDTEEETLKCLYHIGSPQNCLLYQIFDKARDMDEFIVVGGFLYDRLCDFIETHCKEFSGRIKTVYNPLFKEYGSGYSLIKGVDAVSELSDEVIFVEGDLFFASEDFDRIKTSARNVITVNHELIDAGKSVVLYKNTDGQIKYIYDTGHKTLRIEEAFVAVYNSGQIWKFINPDRLRGTIRELSPEQIRSTNLEIVQGYFSGLQESDSDIIPLNVWHNCNTVADYKKVYSLIAQ